MSIKKTMISLAVVAAVAVAAVVAGGMARADRHAPAPRGDIVSHRATEDPQHVREYWTPERMRHARPAPMPTAGD